MTGSSAAGAVAAHDAAAERVLTGQSPYHDLGIVESNPFNHGVPIKGYSYPPIAIGVVAVPSGVLGGVGVVTLLLWTASVMLAVRRYGVQSLAASGVGPRMPGSPISTTPTSSPASSIPCMVRGNTSVGAIVADSRSSPALPSARGTGGPSR